QGLPLPDKPSIAVLPFQNMSGDPEQEYFADGVVEEIITALSRFRQLFVIARNSTYTYKGRAVDVKQVGRELGVRYVLEGSVRKAGERVRITGHFVALAMAEIEHAIADQCGGPVGKHIVEAYNCLGYRAVAMEDEPEPGRAEDLQRLAQRLAIKDQRPAVIHPLIGWHFITPAEGAPTAARQSGHRRREDLEPPLGRARFCQGAPGVQRQRKAFDPRRRPARLCNPSTRPDLILRLGRHTILHPDTEHGLSHDPRIDPFQPVIPPAQRFLKEADRGARQGVVRVGVRPGTDQALAGNA